MKNTERLMFDPTIPRMLGYILTIGMHGVNSIIMLKDFEREIPHGDPDFLFYSKYQFRFLTIWNVIGQLNYAVLGLTCDVLSFSDTNKDLLKMLKNIRNIVFSAIIAPLTMLVASVFWAFFSIERGWMYPPSVDKVLSFSSNHIIHTAIIPVIVWEMLFRPRTEPASHVTNLGVMLGYSTVYTSILIYTSVETGRYLYPVLNLFNYAYQALFFFITSGILPTCYYYLQWYLTGLVWKPQNVKTKEC